MQLKDERCPERSSGDSQRDDDQKKSSCFSNIKIFLVSECALMLAQGTVGAYLVSVVFSLMFACFAYPFQGCCCGMAYDLAKRKRGWLMMQVLSLTASSACQGTWDKV